MAHVAKYAAAACGGMCAHYDRTPELERGYRRDNIDPERTRENYNLAPEREGGQVAFINERIESLDLKRTPRKDAIRMCDCVLTMPKTLDPARVREFFENGYSFLSDRYGAENVVSAYVHMDEAQPHMHFAWVPVTKDGRLSAKDVVTRADLRTLHGDMQKSLEDAMGCRVDVLLDPEQQGEKQLSALSQSEYIAAKDEIAATKTRLEHLQRQVEEVEPAAQTVAESVRTLYKARNDGAREEVLAGEISGLRSRISELEGANRAARERVEELDRGLPGLRGRYQQLEQRFGAIELRVKQVIQRLREVPETVSAWALDIARKLGKRVYDPRSLDYLAREAREAARASSIDRGARPQRRGWDAR